MPNIDPSAKSTMASRYTLRPLMRSARCQLQPFHSQRCFSSSIRRYEPTSESTNHERTTHFGFETVPESEKEARGNIESLLNVQANVYANSCRRFQQRSNLIRYHERLHVSGHPSTLEVCIPSPVHPVKDF